MARLSIGLGIELFGEVRANRLAHAICGRRFTKASIRSLLFAGRQSGVESWQPQHIFAGLDTLALLD
jgi:hypothetical protein